MKKLFALILALIMVLSLVACGGGAADGGEEDTGAADTGDTGDGEALKIAVLLPSSPTDGGWGQTGAESCQYVADTLGAECAIIEAATADVMKSEAEALADDGYKIIFGHGGQYAAPFAEISGDYPDTYFISIGGNIITENQFPLQSCSEQCSYIQGVLAAKITESGIVGAINGGDYPSYSKTCIAFEKGVKDTNPDVTVLYTVMNSDADPNEAYEVAKAQIAEGADFIHTNANMAAAGLARACQEAGIKCCLVGTEMSEFPDYADTMLCSILLPSGAAWLAAANMCISGETPDSAIMAGVNEDAVIWVWNEALQAELPADAQSVYEDCIDGILDGTTDIPYESDLYE
ncbi:MAG: BMP family protein [Oscillospiraceae bacterium]|nr:BMP family protein [Oscillospiraceae bacterium]